MEWKNQWARLLFYAVLLFMLFTMGLYAYLGTFTRYMADDYCSAAALKTEGFWGAQSFWWQNWSGRYSFSFVVSSVELLGLYIVPILPGLAIAVWLSSFVWGCLPLLRNLKVLHVIPGALFLASVALWSTYRSVDDYPQIVFWQTGILTYPVSIILFFLGLGIALRRSSNPARIRWWEILLWFVFAFVAGGFSETGVVIQITLIALLLALVILTKSRQGKIFIPILAAVLIGSVLSLFVIAIAPGNSVRSQGFQNIPPLMQSFRGSLIETFRFLPDLAGSHTTVFVVGFLAGVVFTYFFLPYELQIRKATLVIYLGASLIFLLIATWANIAPSYLLRGGIPPQRVLLSAYFLAACLAIFWGILGALLLRSILPRASLAAQGWTSLGFMLLILIWGCLPNVRSQLELIPALQSYSTLWEERHQSLLVAAQDRESVVVTADLVGGDNLHHLKDKLWLAGDFDSDPNHWINRCAAEYYGVEQIIAE